MQSVDLWCDYINFLQEYDPSVRECSTNGISKLRNLFERAVIAIGLHIAEGSRIYEAYREFEQAIALTIGEADIEVIEMRFFCLPLYTQGHAHFILFLMWHDIVLDVFRLK